MGREGSVLICTKRKFKAVEGKLYGGWKWGCCGRSVLYGIWTWMGEGIYIGKIGSFWVEFCTLHSLCHILLGPVLSVLNNTKPCTICATFF